MGNEHKVMSKKIDEIAEKFLQITDLDKTEDWDEEDIYMYGNPCVGGQSYTRTGVQLKLALEQAYKAGYKKGLQENPNDD